MPQARKSKFEQAIVSKVVEKRHEKKLSQSDIATILEVSRGFIGQIESPNSPSIYSLNQLNRLAYEFGCKPQDLIPSETIIEDYWDL